MVFRFSLHVQRRHPHCHSNYCPLHLFPSLSDSLLALLIDSTLSAARHFVYTSLIRHISPLNEKRQSLVFRASATLPVLDQDASLIRDDPIMNSRLQSAALKDLDHNVQ